MNKCPKCGSYNIAGPSYTASSVSTKSGEALVWLQDDLENLAQAIAALPVPEEWGGKHE